MSRGPVDRARVVAAGVERDPEAALRGEPDGRGDVVRRLRVDDGDGPLVDGEVPRLARSVPAIVARQHDVACEAAAELAKIAGVGHRTGA